jgi:hypothetical protein
VPARARTALEGDAANHKRLPVRPDILPRALNFATRSRFKVG